MLVQDAGILRQMAEAQNTHQHIIYTLQDELMYLANRHGKDSIAYEKNAQRLRLITKMFKQYETVFRAYSDGFTHLEVSNYLLNMTLESYQNEELLHLYKTENPDIKTFNSYNGWKREGCQVQKGSKAFVVWGCMTYGDLHHDKFLLYIFKDAR